MLLSAVGLYFELLLLFPHDEGPPYVEEGVASVDARLELSKIDGADDKVLDLLCESVGVCVRGRLR